LAGILGILVLFFNLQDKYNIQHGMATIGCDCLGAIQAVQRISYVTTKWTNFDLLFRIRKLIRVLKVKICFYKIKAHQDAFRSYQDLDFWEQANVGADRLAKSFLSQYKNDGSPPVQASPQDMTCWTLVLNGTRIINRCNTRIWEHIWTFPGKQFWCRKLHLGAATTQYIWWDVLTYISNMCPDSKLQRYIKIMANIAPVGTQLHLRDPKETNTCPLCGVEESNYHLWQCSSTIIQDALEASQSQIEVYLKRGPDSFAACIKAMYTQLRQRERCEEERCDALSYGTGASQMSLGLISFVWGFFHISWKDILALHFKSTRNSPPKWLASLVLIFWNTWDQLWDLRNEAKHDHTGCSSDKKAIDDSIKHIYDRIPPMRMLNPTEQSFFRLPKNERLRRPYRQKKKWVRDVKIILEYFYARERQSKEVQMFRNYFGVKQFQRAMTSDLAKDTG
jgi:hypothetical protein